MSSTLSDAPATPRAAAGSFTADLRAEYDDLFEAFWNHPFLRGLYEGLNAAGLGDLDIAVLQRYIDQTKG